MKAMNVRFPDELHEELRQAAFGHHTSMNELIIAGARMRLDALTKEHTMTATVTPAHIRELADADYGRHLPVLSREASGGYRVEPEPTAKDHGRTVICDAQAVESWSGGEPMTDEDCATFAAELNAELAETT